MIGVDLRKAPHTAVAINAAGQPLGQLRVRAWSMQAERLVGWVQAWPERAWAVEGAGGTGHLLAEQLLAAAERVLNVPPKLAARVRLLATGNISKNDPHDARSEAVAAQRRPQGVLEAAARKPINARSGKQPEQERQCAPGPDERRGKAALCPSRPPAVTDPAGAGLGAGFAVLG